MPAVLDGNGAKTPSGTPLCGDLVAGRGKPYPAETQALRLSIAIETPAPIVELSEIFFI